MLKNILENSSRLEKHIKLSAQRGRRINILVLESTSNVAKISMLSELGDPNYGFNVTVLSHDQSPISKKLYAKAGVKVRLGGNLEDVIFQEDIDLLFLDHPHYHFEFAQPSHDFYEKIPFSVFSKVLFCYVPYAYISVSNSDAYTDFFHSYSWRFFLESYFHLTELKRHTKGLDRLSNQIVTGHPYIDPYLTNRYDFDETLERTSPNIKRITWCPHHNPVFYGGVSILEQEQVLRNLLDQNTNLEIYFRPHPNLFASLKSAVHARSKDYQTLLDESLLATFEQYWLQHPRVKYYQNGPIFQLFKTSDLIIHNCGGYQMEAVMSRTKVINLVNQSMLNAHVMQFHHLQKFCESKEQLKIAIEDELNDLSKYKIDFTGYEEIPHAGCMIAKHLHHSIF